MLVHHDVQLLPLCQSDQRLNLYLGQISGFEQAYPCLSFPADPFDGSSSMRVEPDASEPPVALSLFPFPSVYACAPSLFLIIVCLLHHLPTTAASTRLFCNIHHLFFFLSFFTSGDESFERRLPAAAFSQPLYPMRDR